MHGKLKSVEEAVALIKDNSTVAFTGSGGGLLESDYVMAAIATRYRENRTSAESHPDSCFRDWQWQRIRSWPPRYTGTGETDHRRPLVMVFRATKNGPRQ
ncbi:Uncharacterised protein [Raoultella ornithinolytica]|nr:Uncharacterised protein [Raoultella ornithinolytica]